uniref:Secreted protein n=1 Tax=Achlya hypogyna TaxID=1202772 RepID=A0A0A7CPL0_ACHHY|nr:secreted protein [Achlya hypogyna]
MFKLVALCLAASVSAQREVLQLVQNIQGANPLLNAVAVQQKVGTFFTASTTKAQEDAQMNTDSFWAAKWGSATTKDALVQMEGMPAPAVFAPSPTEAIATQAPVFAPSPTEATATQAPVFVPSPTAASATQAPVFAAVPQVQPGSQNATSTV